MTYWIDMVMAVLLGLCLGFVLGTYLGRILAVGHVEHICAREWPGEQCIERYGPVQRIVKGRIIGRIIGKPAEWCEAPPYGCAAIEEGEDG